MKLANSLSQSKYLTSAYSAKQVLENEAQVAQGQGVALYDLMKHAGEAAFHALLAQWPSVKSILIVAGKGNNGGDGFVLALLAYQAGIQVNVQVNALNKELKGDALITYQAMLSAGMDDCINHESNPGENIRENITNFNGDVIVDAIFGIGFKGELPPDIQQLIVAVNQNKADVLSIDVPSGLCPTSGNVLGASIEEQAIIATLTVTFIVFKRGLLTGQAANFVGKLQLASLGLNKAFIKEVVSSNLYQQSCDIGLLPKRLACSHKGDSGLLLAIGSGVGMPGAIRLASEGALRCGAGLLAVCCAEQNQVMVLNGRPELMIAPSNADELFDSGAFKKENTIIIGPGLGEDKRAKELLMLLLNNRNNYNEGKETIIDADALTLLANYYYESPKGSFLKSEQWILTPHPKEAARLLNCDVRDIEADRFAAVRAIANQYGGICLLKGSGTLISDGKNTVINSSGNAGMASGGMGDVLSGVVGALVMQSGNNFNAVCTAAYIHGAAADIMVSQNGQLGLLASDLFLPLQKLVNSKS